MTDAESPASIAPSPACARRSSSATRSCSLAAGVRRGRARAGPARQLPRLQPLVGLIVIMAFAYALSTNRRAIDRRTVAWGLALQLLFALLVLKTASASASSRRSAA